MKKLAHKLNSPCSKCPYKKGLIQTVVNPCPRCKVSGYRQLGRFQNHLSESAGKNHV